jgi:hypothetical protein
MLKVNAAFARGGVVFFQIHDIVDVNACGKGCGKGKGVLYRPVADALFAFPMANVIPGAEGGGGKALLEEGEFRGVRKGFEAREVFKGEHNLCILEVREDNVERTREVVDPTGGSFCAHVAFFLDEGKVGVSSAHAKGLGELGAVRFTPKEEAALTEVDASAMADNGIGLNGLGCV